MSYRISSRLRKKVQEFLYSSQPVHSLESLYCIPRLVLWEVLFSISGSICKEARSYFISKRLRELGLLCLETTDLQTNAPVLICSFDRELQLQHLSVWPGDCSSGVSRLDSLHCISSGASSMLANIFSCSQSIYIKEVRY